MLSYILSYGNLLLKDQKGFRNDYLFPPNEDEIRRARGERNSTAENHNRMQRSACLAEQSRHLNSGAGMPPLRQPSTGFDPSATSNSGGNVTGSI